MWRVSELHTVDTAPLLCAFAAFRTLTGVLKEEGIALVSSVDIRLYEHEPIRMVIAVD